MAKMVDRMPGVGGRTPVMSYPWDDWLDGSTWRLERGVDYKVATTAMRAYVYRAARARGVDVETVRGDNGQSLTIRRIVLERDDPGPAAERVQQAEDAA